MKSTPCQHCGTRTGLHGFSFDKNGRYEHQNKLGKLTVLKSTFNPETGEWELVHVPSNSN